jgi:hypothetical protein
MREFERYETFQNGAERMDASRRNFLIAGLGAAVSGAIGKFLTPSAAAEPTESSGRIWKGKIVQNSEPGILPESEEVRLVLPYIRLLSESYGKERKALERLVVRESKWNPLAVSETGAKGLFQLTSDVRADMAARSVEDGRGYARYAKIFCQIPHKSLPLIKDVAVRQHVRTLASRPDPKKYYAAVQSLWERRLDPFASATLGVTYHYALFEDSSAIPKNQLAKRAIQRISQIGNEDIGVINRMRRADGLSTLTFDSIHSYFTPKLLSDQEKLAMFRSLVAYNGEEGKKATYFAISIMA